MLVITLECIKVRCVVSSRHLDILWQLTLNMRTLQQKKIDNAYQCARLNINSSYKTLHQK